MSRSYLSPPKNSRIARALVFSLAGLFVPASLCLAEESEKEVSARWDLISYNIEIKGDKVFESAHRVLTVLNPRGDKQAVLQFDETPFEKIKNLNIELKDSGQKTLKSFEKDDLKKVCGVGGSYQVFNDICYYIFVESVPVYPYTIEVRMQKEYSNPFFFRDLYFPTKVPVTSAVCSLTYQTGTPVRWKSYALPLEFSELELKNKRTCVWRGDNIKPLDFDTLNKTDYDWAGRLSVVVDKFEFIKAEFSGGTWADIGRWYAELLRKHYGWEKIRPQGAPESADARSLCREAYDSIVGAFRYVSISIGVGGWRPRLLENITKTKYGDCKDLSMLLISQLRSSNIESYPVLILTRSEGQIDTDFPSFYFNHLITVAILGSDTLWMDPTCRDCRFDQIPSGDQNTMALVITDTAGILTLTPASSSGDNMIIRKVSTSLDSRLHLSAEMVFEYTGQYGRYLRDSFSHLTGQELNHFVESLISGKSVNYKVKNYSIENQSDNYQPLKLTLMAESIKPLRKVGSVVYLDPCVVEPDFGVTVSDYERIRPIEFTYPRTVIDSFQLVFDSTLAVDSVSYPEARNYSSEIGNWSFSTETIESNQSNEVKVVMKYSLEDVTIQKERFDKLKELANTIESRDNRLVKIYVNKD